jgi:mono/diheme cytochrome c family protein
MSMSATQRAWVGAVLAGAALAGALGGCRGDREEKPPREFFPDLDDQLKWHPQSHSEFFSDGRTMRPRVAGTVAFGRVGMVSNEPWAEKWRTERADMLREDRLFYEGVSGTTPAGEVIYAATIPVAVTPEFVKRGQDRFNIYCTPCHGYLGDGNGMVSPNMSPTPANFHVGNFKDPKALQNQDGYLFHTVRFGKMKPDGTGFTMPGYGHALNERDAWAVVAYLRALQASREGTIQDVPEAQRQELLKSRPAPTGRPAAPAGAGGAS